MFGNFNSQETPVGKTGNFFKYHRGETTAQKLMKTDDLLGNTEDKIMTTSVILRTLTVAM
jgi:hypothetical protein